MSHAGDRDALGSIHHLADYRESSDQNWQTNKKLWLETNEALRGVQSSAQMEYITKQCEDNGVLPRLFLDIATSGAGNPIDKNHDGTVTKAELENSKEHGDATTRFVSEYALNHFDEMDTNHDGKLSTQEMVKYKMDHSKPEQCANPSDTAPYGENGSEKDLQRQILDPHSTPQEKIKAIEELTEKYPDAPIMMKGADGQMHKYEAQVTTLKNGAKLVHLYDEHGKIVLRGVDRNGTVEKEAGANYQGTKYSAEHSDNLTADEKY